MNEIAHERAYWEKHLAGREHACAAFPDVPPETLGGSGEPGRFEFRLAPETAARVLALAKDSDYALFTVLLAGTRWLLGRYCGQSKTAIGTTVFVREFNPGLRNSVLALANETARPQTFKGLLQQEREVVLGAKQHQNFPIARALEWLGETYRPDAFGVMVTLSNLQHSGYAEQERPKLAFAFERTPDGIRGRISYHAERYRPDAVAQIAEHLNTLLLAGCSKPAVSLGEVELLSTEERTRVMVDFSRNGIARSREQTVVAEFEMGAARHPERVALDCEGETLTYAELNRRANRLARHLRATGLEAEEPVALHLTRSIEAVVGILGILKAGGVYLPLDLAHPVARMKFMLEDAGVRRGLARGETSPPPELADTTWIRVDEPGTDGPINRQDPSNPGYAIGPENTAYIIYTSGTTGRPKGVQIPHRGMVGLVTAGDFGVLNGDQTVLLQTSLTFDVSTLEIWSALLNGGRLAISPKRQPSAEELADIIRARRVTVLMVTPGVFNVLVAEQPAALLGVPQIMVGGDVMSVPHTRQFLASYRGTLTNIYGPTENSVLTTYHPVASVRANAGSIPIGRPVAQTEVLVLDESLRPVPVGVLGEIYVGGAGLARGYLKRPGLTAERFIPHPFSTKPGERLYRVGDLGRFLPDGAVEYAGRIDTQVKVRGYRIELGEIESLLNEHPAIKTAAVAVKADASGAKRLLAFAVARNGHQPSGGELYEFLRHRTPAYQIPAGFVFVDQLPLNTSGKVDRNRLLQSMDPAPAAPRPAEAPRTPAEEKLAAIWRQVLGRDTVGIHDDFYALGGDSLLAMQILSRINKAGLRLSAKGFFREPTIAACAAQAVPWTPTAEAAPEPWLNEPVPLTPIQLWFFENTRVDLHHFNLPAMFDLKREIPPAILARAVGHVVRHHDALRLNFTKEADGWTARHTPMGREDEWVELVDLSTVPEAEQRREVERRAEAFQGGLRLEQGPLARFVYFQGGGAGRDRLLVVVHHLVIDAVSWRILIDDLEAVLDQLTAGRPVHLPPKTDAFAVWARQLPVYQRSETAAAGRAYWLGDYAAGETTQGPAARNDEAPAPRAIVAHTFTAEETQRVLRHLPEARRASLEELLLAALLASYAAERGVDELTVTLDRHGRFEGVGTLDVSRTMGWFTAMCPVRLRLNGDRGIEGAVSEVTRVLRGIPNRGIDYGLLRHLGEPDERRRLAAMPGPEMSFNYQGEFDQDLGQSAYFRVSNDPAGSNHSPRHRRSHRIEIDVAVVDGQMAALCSFDTGCYTRAEVERLLAGFAEAVRELSKALVA